MEWIWDERKAAANFLKHGVLFETAVAVFDDPHLIFGPDPHPDDDRWQTIGMVRQKTLFVVHTEIDTKVLAGLSARDGPLRRKERRMKRHVSKGITPEIQANLDYLATLPDDSIDLSDMPEVTVFTGWRRGKCYRPVKQQVTLRLDADVLHWFKTHADGARGYQTKINAALRRFVEEEAKRA